ncbi:T9SS type A sorting domain-containing protein [candidate division KSB1 bacterium]|nr:T9SS type A sorting domain-containing protein [candidate division KSB1 bacterium]
MRNSQNYPNPFNPVTTISYQLPEASTVTLTVFNTAGQEVALLIDGQVSAGFHSIQWDASDMASGIYFYQIQAGNFTDMKRMVVIK